MSIRCQKCGAENDDTNTFCTSCGEKIESISCTAPEKGDSDAFAVKDKGLRWKWVFISIGMILITQFVLGFATGIVFFLMKTSANQPVVIGLITAVSFFLGSMWAAYKSPGLTIKEPAIGSAIWVVLSNLFTGNFSGVILGWVIPYLLALGGAKCGENLQKKKGGL